MKEAEEEGAGARRALRKAGLVGRACLNVLSDLGYDAVRRRLALPSAVADFIR
jgi:hypothetical protein